MRLLPPVANDWTRKGDHQKARDDRQRASTRERGRLFAYVKRQIMGKIDVTHDGEFVAIRIVVALHRKPWRPERCGSVDDPREELFPMAQQ